MTALIVAIVLFALAAGGGMLMAGMRFREKPIPMTLAIAHGLAAASGLVVLIVAVASAAGGAATAALVLFLAAALGGFYLFSIYLRKKPLPIPVLLVHALVAVSGFVALLIAATRSA